MLIGITGIQNAGKDTLCDMITELYSETERRPEAEPVKEAAATFLNLSRGQVEGFKNSNNVRIVVEDQTNPSRHISDITMREFLRLIGHEGRRIFGEDIWINLNIGNKPRNFHWDRIVCITDVRYDNEARVIRGMGGFVVEILRPGLERPDHGSEAGISDKLVDYTICNDKGLDELRLAARALLYDLQTGKGTFKNDLRLNDTRLDEIQH